MTEQELQEIERRLELSLYDMEGCEVTPNDIRALIAECRRLRESVDWFLAGGAFAEKVRAKDLP